MIRRRPDWQRRRSVFNPGVRPWHFMQAIFVFLSDRVGRLLGYGAQGATTAEAKHRRDREENRAADTGLFELTRGRRGVCRCASAG